MPKLYPELVLVFNLNIKKKLTSGRIIVLLVVILSNLFAHAQDTLIKIEAGNLLVFPNNFGGLGSASKAGLIWKGDNTGTAIRRQQFWFSGELNGKVFSIAADPFGNSSDFCKGPIADNCFSHLAYSTFPSVMKLSQTAVQNHILQYKNTGYVAVPELLKWPVNGPSGYTKVLCAFADKNNDKTYQPSSGEYPILLGEENSVAIFSDSSTKGYHFITPCLDILTTWYSIHSDTSEWLKNTIFFRNRVHNHGSQTIDNFNVASVIGFGVGDSLDNYLQTSVLQNALIGYNGYPNDAVFGNKWPWVSFVWLAPAAASSLYFENNSFNAVFGKPSDSMHFYNYSKGLWKSGKSLTFGNRGLDNGSPTQFVFSNGTDTNFKSQVWSEKTVNFPGERHGVISSKNVQILPNQYAFFDGAILITKNSVSDSNLVKKEIAKLITYYQKSSQFLQSKNIRGYAEKIQIYPSPLVVRDGLLTLGFSKEVSNFEVWDMSGKRIGVFENVMANVVQIPWKNKPGIYVVKIGEFTTKILVN